DTPRHGNPSPEKREEREFASNCRQNLNTGRHEVKAGRFTTANNEIGLKNLQISPILRSI
ncbi:MAG: hypothetical protein OEV73_12010, partial [Desulfobulbaceae bacterium]|nr:hypothetical protein [Desulfobulbaceae bacterium]